MTFLSQIQQAEGSVRYLTSPVTHTYCQMAMQHFNCDYQIYWSTLKRTLTSLMSIQVIIMRCTTTASKRCQFYPSYTQCSHTNNYCSLSTMTPFGLVLIHLNPQQAKHKPVDLQQLYTILHLDRLNSYKDHSRHANLPSLSMSHPQSTWKFQSRCLPELNAIKCSRTMLQLPMLHSPKLLSSRI